MYNVALNVSNLKSIFSVVRTSDSVVVLSFDSTAVDSAQKKMESNDVKITSNPSRLVF